MKILYVNLDDLVGALARVNKYFPSIEFAWKTPERLESYLWRVQLVGSWAGCSGTAIGATSARRSRFACWHVNNLFVDTLPSTAIVYLYGKRRYSKQSWRDSIRAKTYWGYNAWHSQLCRCGGTSQEEFYDFYQIDKYFQLVRSRVLKNWSNDVMERFGLSRQRYEDGNPLNPLITGG